MQNETVTRTVNNGYKFHVNEQVVIAFKMDSLCIIKSLSDRFFVRKNNLREAFHISES